MGPGLSTHPDPTARDAALQVTVADRERPAQPAEDYAIGFDVGGLHAVALARRPSDEERPWREIRDSGFGHACASASELDRRVAPLGSPPSPSSSW